MKRKLRVKRVVILVTGMAVIVTSTFLVSKRLKIDVCKNIEVSLNSDVNNLQYIKNIKNGTIITEKAKIDTETIGIKTVELAIKDYFGKEKMYSYKINVVDNEAPEILYSKDLKTTKGKDIDLLKEVKVTDNSKEYIIPIVEGTYDINKVGDYELKYVATDSSGNKSEKSFTLSVQSSLNGETYFTTSKGFEGYTVNGLTYIDGYLVVNKTYSLPKNYGNGLTQETKDAFEVMKAAAAVEGLNIYIASGFRSYETQGNLYTKYVNRDGKEKADTYSARPGHSEHQSGLAFDVNEISDKFIGTPEAIWLENNCYKYGFILRYPKDKSNETGYKYESWHFRYVGEDLAQKLYNNGNWLTMEDYFGITSEYSE